MTPRNTERAVRAGRAGAPLRAAGAWRRLLPGLVLLPLVLGLERPSGLGDVADVRWWSYPSYTRVVVETTRGVRTEVKRLGADPAAGRPERLFFDLPATWVGRRFDRPIEIGDDLLQDVRVAQNTPTRTRVVVDLARYGHHRLFFLTSPHRIVLDVYDERAPRASPSRRTALPPTGREPREQAAPEAPAPLPIDLRPVRTVVIDPGHGGEDPGAIGVGGLREKDLTLEISLELARRLRDRGFEVVLTREDDATLGLEERTARAEGAGGDVFLSVHANAAPRRSARGIETYFLDASHERHSLRVASRENGVPASELDDLQRTLASLRVSEVGSHSAKLARAVHDELVGGVRSSHGSVTDLGVKRGPFHVLFLSGVPSILIETGFVTNRGDARRLRSRYYRAVLAEHIARGLSRYRSERGVRVAGSAVGPGPGRLP